MKIESCIQTFGSLQRWALTPSGPGPCTQMVLNVCSLGVRDLTGQDALFLVPLWLSCCKGTLEEAGQLGRWQDRGRSSEGVRPGIQPIQ